MIYVPVKPEEQDSENVFLNHLGFLSDFYGSPMEEGQSFKNFCKKGFSSMLIGR